MVEAMSMPGILRRDGWFDSVTRIASPNHDLRPSGCEIELIVLHAISLPPGHFGGPEIIDFFCNRLVPDGHPGLAPLVNLRVSSHLLVRRDGGVIQFVSCQDRAWHAGVSCWRGRQRCNDFSLGIELEGDDVHPFTELQYQALDRLLTALLDAYPIREVVGHHDIAPGRKSDPGPFFDWRRLSR